MARVLTAHSLCTNVTDFLIVEANDGTMRNCAAPSRPGTLTNGAAYTTSLEGTPPGINAAVSFAAAGDDRVICTQTAAYKPSSWFALFLRRSAPANNMHFCYQNDTSGYNGLGSFMYVGGTQFTQNYPGIGDEAHHVIPEDTWAACGWVWHSTGNTEEVYYADYDTTDTMDEEQKDWGTNHSPGGTPARIMLGGLNSDVGDEFSFDGLFGVFIRTSDVKNLTWMDGVLDDARDGFPLMLEEATGRTTKNTRAFPLGVAIGMDFNHCNI